MRAHAHTVNHTIHRIAKHVRDAAMGLVLLIAVPSATAAQQGWIAGAVARADGVEPLPNASVYLEGTAHGTLTDASGQFLLGPFAPGTYEVRASLLGFRATSQTVQVLGGDTVRVQFGLVPQPVEVPGIQVSVLRPDLQPQAELEEREVKEANPRDSGELLRKLPGMDAVRRGPVGLDPVVRGLRETEVGVYLDGTRIFPGGPARMDSPLSHLDPSTLRSIEVVKGPYALTWGAGNMSAIRVETQSLPPATPGLWNGSLITGFDSNLNAAETAGSLFGRRDAFSYWVHGAWRQGDDYESGSGVDVPADFQSAEARGKIGLTVGRSNLVFSAGYQDQRDIDYPGRLLNADYFETWNLSARWTWERSTGPLRSFEILGYVNDVAHGMDNDGKPTAQPDSTRTPPFPLLVTVDADVTVTGGRAAANLAPGDGAWGLELGADLYSANRDALRQVSRRDTGMQLFEDLMWPDATITDGGAFLRAERSLGDRAYVAATGRVDFVRAEADTASQFFLDNASSDLTATETNPAGALTVSAAVHDRWSVSFGLGSVARTADATERYSDRIPASKAQTSAEFMGNPQLDPERSTQADVWIEASYPRLSVYVNAFARRIDDYITLEPTSLPKRLPLSPDTVFRYVNGDASFWGAEASVSHALASALTLRVAASYLWGEDETFDEPALGVAPLQGDVALRYERPDGPFFVEGTLHLVSEQDRVASRRGEQPTLGYATGGLQAGVRLLERALLRLSVANIADKAYVNHLNAKNPFTGRQIPEPGRVFSARLSYAF